MSIPAIIVIILFALSIGLELARDGQPEKGKHSFWSSLFATSIFVGLLYWGGFFSTVH